MYFVERLWAVVASVLSIASLSPIQDAVLDSSDLQFPLHVPSPTTLLIASPTSTFVEPTDAPGPIFVPPGTDPSTQFTCNYTAMRGWESCSTERNRQCWLRQKSTGKRFDLFTNYEEEMPVGVDRYYELDLRKDSWAADGINFTDAKLYNNEYPGPWIQACWGDRYV